MSSNGDGYIEQAMMSADDKTLMLGLLRRCDVRSKRMADGRVRLMVYLTPEDSKAPKRQGRRRKPQPVEWF